MPPILGATGWSVLGAALALAGAGGIVLLYLLRRRPLRRVVSSTLLWERALRDAVARRPWQRLRNQLPLWLEVLAALSLAFALAWPLWPAAAARLPGAVWVVDASASMAAADCWAQAIAALENDLRRAGGGFRGALIWAGPEPEVVAGPNATAGQLRAAVAELRNRGPGGAAADWQTALALAYGAAARLPAGSPIRIVTDGSDPALREQLVTGVPGSRPVELVTVGQPIDNTAILAVTVEETAAQAGDAAAGTASDGTAGGMTGANAAGADAAGEVAGGGAIRESATSTTVTTTLAHFGSQPVETRVLLEVDGRAQEAQRVRLEPGQVRHLVWNWTEPGRVFRVALVPGDEYPLDDVGWGVARQPERIRIALLAAGPAGLIERALRLHPGSEVVRLDGREADRGDTRRAGDTPGETAAPGGRSEQAGAADETAGTDSATEGSSGPTEGDLTGYDLLVVSGRPLPEAIPDRLPVIWMNPPAGAGRELGEAFAPRRLAADDHPETARVLHHVRLDSFELLAARPLTLEPGELPLILGDGQPVAALRPAGTGRGGRAVLAFDPYQGTLLLRPAWPLLVQNLLAVLAPGGFGLPAEMTAGDVLAMAPSPLLADVTVAGPRGATVAPGEVLEQPGLYRATARTADGHPVEAFFWARPHPAESRAVSEGGAVDPEQPGSAKQPGGAGQPEGTGQPEDTGSPEERAGPGGAAGAGSPGGPAGATGGEEPAETAAARMAAAPADPWWRVPVLIALLLLVLDAWVVRHAL